MNKVYNPYFPIPSYLAMNSCSLDISDLSIKYGEIESTSRGLKLARYGQEKIPAGVIVSGKIENQEELIRILKKLQQRENLHFVRVSLPEEQMYLFTLTLPLIKKEDIRDAILLQLEEHIPLQTIDTTFDYDIVNQTKDSVIVEVLAIATSMIESYLSIFRDSGLIPLSFELEAQAITRAVISQNNPSPAMIVDFGEARTGVSIAYNGRAVFTTTLDIGGATLTSMIAKNFSVSLEEAEKIKRAHGLRDTSDNDENIFPVILNGLSVLRDELVKQLTYWKTHAENSTPHQEIERIILCGGDSNILGLAEYLETSMGLKVENANAWVNISQLENTIPDMTFEESLGYVTVLGLALADHISSGPLMNVLPLQEKKSLKRNYWIRYSGIFSGFTTVLALMICVLLVPSYVLSQSKLATSTKALEDFNKNNPEIATYDVTEKINALKPKLSILSAEKASLFSSGILIRNFIENRPKGIKISSISYDEKKIAKSTTLVRTIELHGVAVDRVTLRTYKALLLTSPDIAEVNLPISDFLERSDINFTMAITLK